MQRGSAEGVGAFGLAPDPAAVRGPQDRCLNTRATIPGNVRAGRSAEKPPPRRGARHRSWRDAADSRREDLVEAG